MAPEIHAKKVPADFYFEMEFGDPKRNCNTDKFNSKTARFQRRYSYGDTAITIQLSDQEMEGIYLSFIQNDFFNLPETLMQDTFLGKGVDMTDISFFNSKQLKKVRCFNYESLPQTEELNRFGRIKKCILNGLNSKPNYRSLMPSNLVGL